MRRISQAITLALLVALPFTSSCARDDRPNIVFITLDTTRADRLGAYGDPDAHTPVLDGLATRGTLFERAYSPVPLTLPAHTTLMTGLNPVKHGVRDNTRFVVSGALETLAERFKATGYATGAFVSALVLDSSFGLDQGFDVYSDQTHGKEDPLSVLVPQRPGEETTDAALSWLGTKRRQPFFLWTHYYDPHEPRTPHAPFSEEINDPYAAAIAYMDAQLGRLLAGVGKAAGDRTTLILVVADHGESLGEHGEATHGTVAYDSTLRVPLIVVGPGFEPGSRSKAFVTIEDVAPTLLAAAGEAPPVGSEGIPLQTLLTNPNLEERVTSFECLAPFYTFGWAPLAGVRTSRWKYTAEPGPPELYDVLADPGELNNLFEDQPKVVARLAARYEQQRSADTKVAASANDRVLDPAIEAQLAALGYLSVPQEFAAGKAPDPRKAVALVGWVDRALEVARSGRLADGIEALTILTEEPSVRALAWLDLALLYEAAGHEAKAIEALQSLLALSNELTARIRLANLLLVEGQPDASLAVLSENPAQPAGDPPILALARGEALLALGRYKEAEAAASQVLARDPARDEALALASRARAAQTSVETEIAALQRLLEQPPAGAGPLPEVRLVLAAYLRSEKRDAEAVKVLEAEKPPTPAQQRVLAEIAVEQGDGAKAATLYESLLERIPVADDVRRDLADLYDTLGRSEEAIPLYDELIAVSPEDATLRVDRGTTLFRLGRFTEAEQDFRTAISQNDEIPEAHFNLALLDLRAKRDAEAETQLKRAIELRPDFAKAHFHLANLYRMRGDPRAAYHAEQAIQLSGQIPSAIPVSPNSNEGSKPIDPKVETHP